MLCRLVSNINDVLDWLFIVESCIWVWHLSEANSHYDRDVLIVFRKLFRQSLDQVKTILIRVLHIFKYEYKFLWLNVVRSLRFLNQDLSNWVSQNIDIIVILFFSLISFILWFKREQKWEWVEAISKISSPFKTRKLLRRRREGVDAYNTTNSFSNGFKWLALLHLYFLSNIFIVASLKHVHIFGAFVIFDTCLSLQDLKLITICFSKCFWNNSRFPCTSSSTKWNNPEFLVVSSSENALHDWSMNSNERHA